MKKILIIATSISTVILAVALFYIVLFPGQYWVYIPEEPAHVRFISAMIILLGFAVSAIMTVYLRVERNEFRDEIK